MARYIALVTERGFQPTDADGWEQFKKLARGSAVTIEVKRARNPKQHRLYWALMNKMFEHQSRFVSVHDLSDWVKVQVGFFTEIPGRRPGDPPAVKPNHLDYANCPPEVFEPFFERVMDFVAQEILPRVPQAEIKRELEEMVGLNRPGGGRR